MSTKRIALFLGAVWGAVIVDIVAYGTGPGNAVHVATYLAICCTAWRASLRLPPGPGRRPWLLVAVALTSWCIGDLVELGQFYFAEVPGVGVADIFWLAGYPLIAVALVQMARRRAPGRLRGGMLDAMALTVAASAALWQFVVAPTLGLGYGLLDTLVPALYPLCDVVLLAAALFVALSPGARGVPTRLVLGAVVFFLGIDLGYNILPFMIDYSLVQRLGPLILAGGAMLVAACLHPSRGELTAGADRLPVVHPARVIFLGLALMTAPTLTLMHKGFGREEVIALIATAVCSTFVLARFTNAVREQERAQAQLAHQAGHDTLTGVANRATLDDRLRRLLASDVHPVSLLYLDLDGFKEVNDRHGHEAGDRVLTAVADRLGGLVRQGDIVARLGGDEFVVVCPGLTEAEVAEVAGRILREVARPVPFGVAEMAVGVSVGVAIAAEGSRSPAALLRAADAAMYEAKRHGQGRWVLAEQHPATDVPVLADPPHSWSSSLR
ncbi:GGDEF domain-containing protein [Actinoplanes sp. N902-109]|uniref:GGDEF domain-containing protein n=1 Tax=Actinoplanes sp. (strain N902-109) TaxID=649831 RepID=UPI0003296839|nr:GGDEF domain-containing protein [Actinoplanes sp. N902-109]AGL16440.1 diguanylate cyclase/phosphodiesterase [Actinoplanes sp. N902-109]